jgi:hypothetical protein
MTLLLVLSRPGGSPPPPWILLLVPLVFLGATWLTNKLLGIAAMYQDWPADQEDPIEQNLGWNQIEFGTFRGHTPISIKFGRRCLHLKQPFPFQPLYWRGPASIPWNEVLLEKALKEAWWAFLSPADFRLGQGGRLIRLRGKAARTLQEKVREKQVQVFGTPPSSAGPEAIRPR